MPSRRLHHKTRHGCTLCKARRVKCDENRPACRRCVRNGAQCSLLDSGPNTPIPSGQEVHFGTLDYRVSTPQTNLGSTSSVLVPNSLRVVSAQDTPLNIPLSVQAPVRSQWSLQDLELMHYYSTVACFSISNIRYKQRIWQTAVPKEAVSHGFLMHALLSLAAVHRMHTSPKQRHVYEETATRHRNLALAFSIKQLHNINPMNCNALFAFSGIVSFLNLVLPHSPSAALDLDPLDDIIEFFVVLRGVKTVLKSAMEWIAHGSFAQIPRHDWNPIVAPLQDDVESAFGHLEERIEETTEDDTVGQIYKSAIRELRIAFQTCEVIAEEPTLVFIWPATVPEAYIAALRKREPMALAILGYYTLLLHGVDSQWWLKGRGRLLIETICQKLPPEWLPTIEWPRNIIQKGWEGAVDFSPLQDLCQSTGNKDVAVGQDDQYEGFLYRKRPEERGDRCHWRA